MAFYAYPNEQLERPHTQVIVGDSQIGSTSSDSQKAVVVMGSANGGKPGVLYAVTSFPQAKNIFRGGEILDFIEAAWNPSESVQGAGTIYAMRVENATQGSLEKGAVSFKSALYGKDANKVSLKLEDNELTKTRRLTIISASDNVREVYDNLGPIFNVTYKGTEPSALATITDKTLTIKVGVASSEITVMEYTLSGSTFDKVSSIITDINAHADFSASFIPYGSKNIDSAYLDPIIGGDLKADGGFTATGLVGDLILNTAYSQLISVGVANVTIPHDLLSGSETPLPEIGTTKLKNLDLDLEVSGQTADSVTLTQVKQVKQADQVLTLENFATTNLVGGSNGFVPNTWAPFFHILGNDDAPRAYYVVTLTPNQAIHAELSAFVNEQSNSGYAMRGIVGGSLGESLAQTMARQTSLYNPRMVLVGFDAELTMTDGRSQAFPAYMATALVAGLASGQPVAEPITYKQLRITKLLRDYDSNQLNQLHVSGVIGAEKVRNIGSTSFRIVSDVTTYNNPDVPVKSELSLGEETDFLGMQLRERLDNLYIGTKVQATSADRMKMSVASFLLEKVNDATIEGYTTDDISVVIIGDKAEISFVVNPSRGLNRINASIIYRTTTIEA